MNYDKLDSNNFTEYQKIILLMKNIGLIKDKSEQCQSLKNIEELHYE